MAVKRIDLWKGYDISKLQSELVTLKSENERLRGIVEKFCEYWVVDSDWDRFAKLYTEALKALESERLSEWLPYPENKPEISGIYLVTAYNPRTNETWVQRDIYDVVTDRWDGIYVKAFRPLPEPHESEE